MTRATVMFEAPTLLTPAQPDAVANAYRQAAAWAGSTRCPPWSDENERSHYDVMADLCAANVAERAREAGHAIAGFAWTADARRRVSQEWADDLAARDAEIARLKEELEAATATIEDEQAAHEETRADAARLTKELEEARAQSRMDEKLATDALAGHVAGKLRADAAEAQAKALREALEWAQGCIVRAARALALAAKGQDIDHSPLTLDSAGWAKRSAEVALALMEVDAEISERLAALAPPEPKAEAEPLVFCGAVEPGHDGEHSRTPRCWYPHKAGEASPADWVNIPRAAPPPAETAGQKEGP